MSASVAAVTGSRAGVCHRKLIWWSWGATPLILCPWHWLTYKGSHLCQSIMFLLLKWTFQGVFVGQQDPLASYQWCCSKTTPVHNEKMDPYHLSSLSVRMAWKGHAGEAGSGDDCHVSWKPTFITRCATPDQGTKTLDSSIAFLFHVAWWNNVRGTGRLYWFSIHFCLQLLAGGAQSCPTCQKYSHWIFTCME